MKGLRTMKRIKINDDVFWNDPNDNISSGYYKVIKIINDDVSLISNKVGETEVFNFELITC
ncbi:hypothetical protein LCGC14_1740100 [marine sediment metagenome]|uniref:Uncharacterized protein n=1 Tax=marine sediment metagenome TaxID=412755 RepID=A0A0F9H714_9ZZZZ